MPAAARSGSPEVREPHEARVPCPQCGGLIHPIAGKCKHCKTDLASYRAARPAANAPLPALGPPVMRNGHPPHAPIAHAVPLPRAAETVLPPRPTGRAETAPSSAWRSWPVLVIVLAMLAIVAAVVIMVWPAGRGSGGKRALQPPPAPERMDTQTPPVMPKVDAPQPHAQAPGAAAPAQQDPWAQPAPRRDPQPDPTAQDDDAQADDDLPATPAVKDPFGQRTPRRRLPQLSGGGMVELAMTARICRKLVQCGTSDASLRTTCEAIANLPADPPAGCPAAERCLRRIDAMGCSSQPDALQLGMLLMQFRDCAEAERC